MRFTSTTLAAFLWLARSHSSAYGVVGMNSRRRLASVASVLLQAKTTDRRTPSYNLVSSSRSPSFQQLAFRGGAALTFRGGASLSSSTQLRASTTTAEVESAKAAPVEIFRGDYQPLPFTVSKVSLDVSIRSGETTIQTEMTLTPNPDSPGKSSSLILDGDEQSVTLQEIKLDGTVLKEGVDYKLSKGQLEILNIPSSGAILQTTVTTVPEDNTQLAGLYKSGSMYCTQMEAMGFRRMTYYPDRPDNMAIFERVRIEAEKDSYPVLLSNGNLVEEGLVVADSSSEDGSPQRHYAVWSDPFPKPSYLFAVVAGNLGSIQDSYTTTSGRKVQLQIFSEHKSVNKLQYAMDSLKRSMQWDEDRFGLEYDLDLYNIVATEDFNMGAMENKGLNVFNTALVLADQKTATDADFERVEGVIGHEYFHNWTGNRVVSFYIYYCCPCDDDCRLLCRGWYCPQEIHGTLTHSLF
jgi:aminopeptidase N